MLSHETFPRPIARIFRNKEKLKGARGSFQVTPITIRKWLLCDIHTKVRGIETASFEITF